MSLFRRDPYRDLVPVHYKDVEEAFQKLGYGDQSRVEHLHLSATNDANPHDILWIRPEQAELLGVKAKRGKEQA